MMATSRDFVYDEQGEMLPSDSAAAAARRKELDDDARTVSDAKDAAKAPAKAPVAAKPKSGVVTKEELAKSGLSLRDYMNKQRGLTRRDGKAPERKTAPAVSSSYRSEGANKAKPAAPSGNVASAAEKPKTAVASKQREADEKRREERREFGRQRDAKEKAEKEKFTKNLSSDSGQMAIRKEREAKKSMSPAERSAARGSKIKEFFGMAKGGSINGIAKRGLTKCKTV
jgi:hypothetical protein